MSDEATPSAPRRREPTGFRDRVATGACHPDQRPQLAPRPRIRPTFN